MSETDKYVEAVDTMGDLYLNQEDDVAAAYLREHFVTREEYDRLQRIIDSRPAINAGLPATYIEWSQSIYAMEIAHAQGGAQ